MALQAYSVVVAEAHHKQFAVPRVISELVGMMYNATASYRGANVLYHIEDTGEHRSFQE